MNDRYIRKEEVKRRTGLSDTTIWRHERNGIFPKRRQLGPNSVGWLERDINRWLESRPAA